MREKIKETHTHTLLDNFDEAAFMSWYSVVMAFLIWIYKNLILVIPIETFIFLD